MVGFAYLTTIFQLNGLDVIGW